MLENFPDGVRFVDLAPLSGMGLVMDAIATVIGAKIDAELNAADALARALEGTQTLIILDNCEHVLAESAAALRHCCARMVTSVFWRRAVSRWGCRVK